MSQQTPSLEPLLTVKDLTAMLQVDPATIYRHVKSGKLPKPFKIGSVTRWHPQTVRDFLAQKSHGGAQ